MGDRFRRGRLAGPATAPTEGERVEPLAELPGLVIEQILSGALPQPVFYEQSHDEWVLVLTGSATLLVAHERLELATGEWLLLPAGCPHTVVSTAPGTSWLAVHAGRST